MKKNRMVTEPQEKVARNYFLFFVIITLFIISVSVFLIIHYVQLNHEYIIHPEISPGYSECTPFGDGGDVWRKYGIYLPTSLLVLLILLNTFGIVSHVDSVFVKWYVIVGVVLVYSGLVSIFPLFYDFFCGVSFLLMIPEVVLVPSGVVFAIVLFAKRRRILAGHIFLLALCMGASFILELFNCYLFLD